MTGVIIKRGNLDTDRQTWRKDDVKMQRGKKSQARS